jgi:hypothetical protein
MFSFPWLAFLYGNQGRIQDFKLGGGAHLKKLRRSEGGAKDFGVFRVKNHDFTPKNLIFSNFRGAPPPPPLVPPLETDANYFNTVPGLPIGIEHFSRYRFIYLFISNLSFRRLNLVYMYLYKIMAATLNTAQIQHCPISTTLHM